MRRCATALSNGPTACVERLATDSLKKSRHFALKWRCMGAIRNHVRGARQKFNAYVMRPTKPTTARTARPEESCSPTTPCRDCCERTGLELRKNLRCWRGSDGKLFRLLPVYP